MKEENSRILIVDDEKVICEGLARLLREEKFIISVAHDGKEALKIVRTEKPDLVLSDIKMPIMDGLELLAHAKKLDPDLPVVLITGYADIPGAVIAMKTGAHDYLAKPFDHNEVVRVVHRALSERRLKLEIAYLSNQRQRLLGICELMGMSDVIRRLDAEVSLVAKTDYTLIILGETGTGKELVARTIHERSTRSRFPFVPVDCGAIPEALFESEFFGHEKGAFTGAMLPMAGKFEVAKGGTLFLDEFTNMPLGCQTKLLRVLQERQVYRLGKEKPVDLDVRLLAATNYDLDAAVTSDVLRQDLFFRLNEYMLRVPPLRERKEDILYLAKRFLDEANAELKKQIKEFSEDTVEAMLAYSWPGNVRQLRSVTRRAVLLADKVIELKHLDIEKENKRKLSSSSDIEAIQWKDLSLKEIVRHEVMRVERDVLKQVLQHTGGNKAEAARLLHIDYKTIYVKIKQLGIPVDGGANGY